MWVLYQICSFSDESWSRSQVVRKCSFIKSPPKSRTKMLGYFNNNNLTYYHYYYYYVAVVLYSAIFLLYSPNLVVWRRTASQTETFSTGALTPQTMDNVQLSIHTTNQSLSLTFGKWRHQTSLSSILAEPLKYEASLPVSPHCYTAGWAVYPSSCKTALPLHHIFQGSIAVSPPQFLLAFSPSYSFCFDRCVKSGTGIVGVR
jgi:hypothetical protein